MMHGMSMREREIQRKKGERGRERGCGKPSTSGWMRMTAVLVEIQQVWFPPLNGVFSPPPPPLTWQAVKCGSLWCVEALDCIHAHRSRQPLIHWMTSHKKDKPVRAVVRALQHVMNRLFCVALHILLFFFLSVYYNHATGYLLSAVSCAVCEQASIQKKGGEAAEQTSQI